MPVLNASSAGATQRIVDGLVRLGPIIAPTLPSHGSATLCGNRRRRQQRLQVESRVPSDLFQQIGAAHGLRQRRQSKRGQQLPNLRRKLVKEAHHMLRLAAEFCAQFRPLRRDSGGAGIQMALPRHVAAQCDQHRQCQMQTRPLPAGRP